MNEHDNLKVFDVIIPNIKCGYLTIEQGETEHKLCRIMGQDCSIEICPKPKPDARPDERLVDELIEAYEAYIKVIEDGYGKVVDCLPIDIDELAPSLEAERNNANKQVAAARAALTGKGE